MPMSRKSFQFTFDNLLSFHRQLVPIISIYQTFHLQFTFAKPPNGKQKTNENQRVNKEEIKIADSFEQL